MFEDQVTNLSHVTAGCHCWLSQLNCHNLTERVLSRRLLRCSNSPESHEDGTEDRAREAGAPPDETAAARRLLTRLRSLSSVRWKEVYLMTYICNFPCRKSFYY